MISPMIQIPDPDDKKPEGYDDIPATIPDPEVSSNSSSSSRQAEVYLR